jgi:hypothetical protein
MPIRLPRLAVVLSCALALPAFAQSIKPGLWEVNNKAQSGDGKLEQAMAEMQKQMAALGPEQRKMMEDMMAKQGVTLGTASGGVSVKMCLTKEMVAQNEVPLQTQGDCTQTRKKSGPNALAIHFVCTNPPSHGDGVATFTSDTAYTMTMQVASSATGKEETMSLNAHATWLGSDCGAIKPFVMPKVK